MRTNVIKEQVVKQRDDEHSSRFFNYLYQALEEAVVNAMYHRDYQVREPVEITIEPEMITILSFSGPDRSISMDAIRKAELLKSRRYRNRRLGEFLKDLELTEGRATGIPTIQRQLKDNESPKARIETDENRSYFMIELPCHKDFVGEVVLKNGENFGENFFDELSERQRSILKLMSANGFVTANDLARTLTVSSRTIQREISFLRNHGYIDKEGKSNKGFWKVLNPKF